ncbi:sporulation membrane protein YtaF [Pradoshia sp.]
MEHLASILLLAVAVSLDSCGVGMTYGIRKVSIPLKSIMIIAACSALSFAIGMFTGSVSEHFMAESWAGVLGGLILISLGVWTASSNFKQNDDVYMKVDERTLFQLEIKSIGLVIHILKKPLSADFDRSGTITGLEACFLGFALSLDGFGAGIGAGILNYPLTGVVLLSFIMSAAFMKAGLSAGKYLNDSIAAKVLSFVPGIVLIALGISKLF